MKSYFDKLNFRIAIFLLQFVPIAAHADVRSMVDNLQAAILDILAPIICVGGIIFGGFRLAMGDESAKRMIFWSCVGAVISFTAPSILSFLHHNVAG